jgi:hypothetical protein
MNCIAWPPSAGSTPSSMMSELLPAAGPANCSTVTPGTAATAVAMLAADTAPRDQNDAW